MADNINIRPTRAEDVEWVMAVERHADNSLYIGNWSHDEHMTALHNSKIWHFIIEEVGGERLGFFIVREVGNNDDCIELKRIAIQAKGRGLGHLALQYVKRFAFDELKAHRLQLDVVAFNDRARHLYESEGFILEGILRENMKYPDGYQSLVLMSILRDEYYQSA